MNTVIAPETETYGETFLWYRPTPRLQLGVAYLWRQGAFRGLANYELIPETARTPNLRIGFGLQGVGTGNPGYFATSEKNFMTSAGNWNAYVGIGFRANEDHAHPLGGVRFSPRGPWTIGFQHDGHDGHPFVSFTEGPASVGLYYVQMKSLGAMLSLRF